MKKIIPYSTQTISKIDIESVVKVLNSWVVSGKPNQTNQSYIDI